MDNATLVTTNEEIDVALERAKSEPIRPCVRSAEYSAALDVVVLKIDDGRRLIIPREELEGLEDATESQLMKIEVFSGQDIAWPELGVDHYLPYLLEGKYSTERWKRQQAERRKLVAA